MCPKFLANKHPKLIVLPPREPLPDDADQEEWENVDIGNGRGGEGGNDETGNGQSGEGDVSQLIMCSNTDWGGPHDCGDSTFCMGCGEPPARW